MQIGLFQPTISQSIIIGTISMWWFLEFGLLFTLRVGRENKILSSICGHPIKECPISQVRRSVSKLEQLG